MGQYTTSRPTGFAEWTGGDAPAVARDCLCCCHCSKHFFVTPGSGKKRGYCMNCGQVTCGQKKCDTCIHWKKKLELIEAGKADMSLITTGKADGLPVSVAIPVAAPGPDKKLILP